ncbi:MAG: BlaI/MecI/CopY family transcriptional regulator [Parvularculaceae bacterium]|nr:BlaI/MecI/CopY family transcriptional regulator [Parvularculaceae bacterium]
MANPSDTELILLKVLWRDGRLSARELHEAAAAQTRWSFSATRKTLERMEAKELILVEKVHGIKTYRSGCGKIEVMARLIKNFATNVLGSDQPLPSAAFVNSNVIEPDEIDELEAMLEQLAEEDEA